MESALGLSLRHVQRNAPLVLNFNFNFAYVLKTVKFQISPLKTSYKTRFNLVEIFAGRNYIIKVSRGNFVSGVLRDFQVCWPVTFKWLKQLTRYSQHK